MKKLLSIVFAVVLSAVVFTQVQAAPSEGGKCRIVYMVKRERVQLGKISTFMYYYIPRLICERTPNVNNF